MSPVWQPSQFTRQQMEERRLAAEPLLKDSNHTSVSIAEHFGVKPSTVRVWRKRLREEGSLQATPTPGRPAALNDAQVAELIEDLQKGPDPQRYPDGRFTTARVREHIGLKFGIWYDHDWVGKLLHRWGFSWQKAEKRPLEQKQKDIDAWLEKELPALEKKGGYWRNHRLG